MARIHPTAIVEPGADLDASVEIGPYSIVRSGVKIGRGTIVGPHVVIEGATTIGEDNRISQFCSLGGVPQDKKYAGEPTELHIGERNTIREYCNFNIGTAQDAGVTRIGSDNWLMNNVHIAHDCQVGNQIVIAGYAGLAGHVHLEDWVIVGAQSGVHQFGRVGAHAFIGFQSHVSQDVPPFMMAEGQPLSVRGFNVEGLRRRGYTPERIAVVKQMHRLLYRSSLTFEQSREAIAALASEMPHAAADIALMTDFLAQATRGIVR